MDGELRGARRGSEADSGIGPIDGAKIGLCNSRRERSVFFVAGPSFMAFRLDARAAGQLSAMKFGWMREGR